MIFLPLSGHHNRTGFDCGNEAINTYLRQMAGQQGRKELARTVVMVEDGQSPTILGFFTLVMSTISCDVIPLDKLKLPRGRTVPVILLAQFGVDHRWQGQGYGKELLFQALFQSMQAAEHAGCLAVVLDAVDEHAAAFYRTRGFEPLSDHPRHLWIRISTIREMFGKLSSDSLQKDNPRDEH